MNELTAQQVAILERVVAAGSSVVAFPLYANAVGVRKGSCAALLEPFPGAGFRVFGKPCVWEALCFAGWEFDGTRCGRGEILVCVEKIAGGGDCGAGWGAGAICF